MMPKCDCLGDRREHTAEAELAKMCQQPLSTSASLHERTPEVPVRLANSKITVPNVVTPVNRGTVFGQPWKFKSDGTERLRMTGYVSFADCHENIADFAPESALGDHVSSLKKSCRTSPD